MINLPLKDIDSLLWTICRWISGLSNIEDHFVWANALRYVFNVSLKDKYVDKLLFLYCWGTGIRGLVRGMATLPQGNQELIVVRDKVGTPQVGLGSASPWNVIFFPSVPWHCWLGDRKGIWPIKNWMLVCWWWWFDWGFAWLIAPVVKLSPPPPSSFASINTV